MCSCTNDGPKCTHGNYNKLDRSKCRDVAHSDLGDAEGRTCFKVKVQRKFTGFKYFQFKVKAIPGLKYKLIPTMPVSAWLKEGGQHRHVVLSGQGSVCSSSVEGPEFYNGEEEVAPTWQKSVEFVNRFVNGNSAYYVYKASATTAFFTTLAFDFASFPDDCANSFVVDILAKHTGGSYTDDSRWTVIGKTSTVAGVSGFDVAFQPPHSVPQSPEWVFAIRFRQSALPMSLLWELRLEPFLLEPPLE